MYSVSIPVNCDKFYRCKDKNLLLNELRAFDADRVFLNFETVLDGHILLHNEVDYQRQIDRMTQACAFFHQHGYEVGAWFWGLQFDEHFSFTTIKTLKEKEVDRFACPTDRDFLEAFCRCLRDVAKTGVDIILLNDDIRFGAWGGFGCLCKNHVKMIYEELGEQLDEQTLKERIVQGGENPYRDAFLKANRHALEHYAITMRHAVDEVNPDVRMGFCACMTSWDIDGDAFALSRLFAGRTRPILRLIGAPYWVTGGGRKAKLQFIVEMERLEASWNPYDDVEVIAEGDVYPRPRLNCPASYLEGFDTALRASGEIDGILRICMDYVSNVGYENGYLKQYRKNMPVYQAIEKHFHDKNHVGVRVYESQHKVSRVQIPSALGTDRDMEECFYSAAARVLTASAIPTVYKGRGVTGIAFGENALDLDAACFENGLIIDALAAKILSDRGIDVGVDGFGARVPIRFEYVPEDDNYIIAQDAFVFDLKINEKAQILSLAAQDLDKPQFPFCYRYQNAEGQRFLVFNCIGEDGEMLLRHYANARIISDNTEWLGGSKLPAFCCGHPYLYLQCKEDAKSMVIGIWNFFEDEAIEPIVELGRRYQDAQFLCGSGTLCEDTIRWNDIAPYGFCAVVLKK